MKVSEHLEARILAHGLLEDPFLDPDSDLVTLARQLLRADEKIERLEHLNNLAREWLKYDDARHMREGSVLKCHSVDGHGTQGFCDCFWGEHLAAQTAYRLALKNV